MSSSIYPESSSIAAELSPEPSTGPLVSIIIGNYNYDRYVGQAIESCLNQTYSKVEVIVVDDGSQDRSRDVIASYGDRIIPVFKENGGQPSNYNAGFAASRGEIICFLDSDDLFTPNKVETLVKVFQSSPEIGWYFHSIQLIDEHKTPLPISITENYPTQECDFRKYIVSGHIPPSLPPSSGLCFRRSVLEKILPMPTAKLITNNDYYVKFLAVGLTKGFVSADALTLQMIHGNNAATLQQGRPHLLARKYIYTGIWIRQTFPQFRAFANKLLAVGIGFNWVDGKANVENCQAIQTYLASSFWLEKMNIYLRAFYYYIKNRA
jgi:glycosyltransferase involved in cell wall biosynthesis